MRTKSPAPSCSSGAEVHGARLLPGVRRRPIVGDPGSRERFPLRLSSRGIVPCHTTTHCAERVTPGLSHPGIFLLGLVASAAANWKVGPATPGPGEGGRVNAVTCGSGGSEERRVGKEC